MLSQRGLELQERDFFREPLSEAELRALLGGRPASDVFSWRSPSFKVMGLDPAGLADDDLVRLMLQEPRLIRRPIVRIDGELIVGADRKKLDAVLGPA